ncbi:MarR family winged helix-turn-helix transcriptional regulator [Sphingomicrobium flavum]|uniref:MarR family winged helix-turn-helix transcriptional regulator n=1 Tax=Sphingomicrobium flavum TaxID=1229164 RepID=UPI0021AD72DD|nr:MarR family winged helix-turn-helix transcriptional regulator [Sphingomicrobium flavum]
MAVNDDEVIRLGDFLPYQVVLLADRIGKRIAAVLKSHDDMNLSHWRVLAAVAEVPGRTANEVVAVTPMDKGIVSRAVKSLIGEGLLERRASDSDGRLGHLHLTTSGETLYRAIAADIRAVEKQMRASLPPGQWADMQSALSRLLAALG